MTFKFLTAGESHGKELTAIIQGVPAGLKITAEEINEQLFRRQQGYGRGGRMKIESDKADITSGVRDSYTMGSPITLTIKNKDWENWQHIMTAQGGAVYEKKVTLPRPGHADLSGGLKYRQADLRNILERASARETAARVAVGTVAKRLLAEFNINIYSHVTAIGSISTDKEPTQTSLLEIDNSPVRCIDKAAELEMMKAIDEAKQKGETLGGIFEVIVHGLPIGLGSHTQWDEKLDGQLAQALISIPAIKGVEIGEAFKIAQQPGSKAHDVIDWREGFIRPTNYAGGLEGGITNGEPLIIRAAMKPIPTLMKPLQSIEMSTKERQNAVTERSDVCAVPAAAVVGEAMTAITLAAALINKFGGDHIEEMKSNYDSYQEYLRRV